MGMKPANFLIVDEPTNHLDDETKKSLQKALKAFEGNLLLVTHEEGFYAGWIDSILNVENIRIGSK